MADANIGSIQATLSVDARAWQQGLQQASQQLAQFQQGLTQQAQQTASQTQQFARAQTQAALQASREQMQAARLAAQEQMQAARLASTERIAAARAASQAEMLAFRQATEAARQAAREQRDAMRAAQTESRGSGGMWAGILQVAGGIGLATTISGIVSSLKDLVAESIQAAAKMETLRAQFTALQGTAQAGVTLTTLFTTAQRLGVEFGTLANAFRQFDAATQGTALEGAKAQRVFEQVTTGMRGMGASSEQVGRALLALQQMIGKGVVSQEELRQQLGEALPGSMNIAARAFGVTTQEMNKMIEKGMDAVQFVQIFGNQVEREFAGKAATATNTLTSAWQRFSNELEQFQGALAGGELVNQLRDLANWAAAFLATMRQARELRQEAVGGPAPAIPPEMAGMRTLEARQKEIEALRRTMEIGQRGFAYPGEVSFFGGMPTPAQIEEVRVKLLALQKQQQEAIQRMQDQWAAENEQPMTAAQLPGARTTEAIRKRYEEGLKELRAIDATAAFVTPLELAEEKAKAWHKVMQDIRQEAGRIGEGLRSTLVPTGKTTPFDEMITRIAGEKGLDPNLMRALIEQESGFDPRIVSPAGARGLMQLMPGTAARYGAGGREFEPEANLRAGMTYFAELLRQFNGNVEKALTAYNAGPARGGIPLPSGENATFAQDVLRRMPQGAGGLLAGGQRLEEALRLGVEAERPDTESAARIRAIGREDLQRIEQGIRQAAQDQETYQAAIDKTRMSLVAQQDTAVQTLGRLEEAYTQTAAGQDRLTAAKLAAKFPENEEIQRRAQLVTTLSEEAEATKESFNAIKQRTDALREAADAEQDFQNKLDQAEVRLRTPREEREEARLRLQARAAGHEVTPAQEAQLQRIRELRQEQERLTMATEIWQGVASGIGSAWSQALQSVADGTKTVAEAFRAMGQSILQTFADIAAQQATQAFFKLGLSLLTGALTSGGQVGFGAGSGFDASLRATVPLASVPMQHGGIVRAPTLAMLGEGPSSTLPEYVMNQSQMNSIMARGGTSAATNVVVNNFPSRQAAEEDAARQRSQGHTVIVNAILDELSTGESSRINRAMRALQR